MADVIVRQIGGHASRTVRKARTRATKVGCVAVALPFMYSSWMRTIAAFVSATDHEVGQ